MLSASKYSDFPTDFYGQGKLVQKLEARMAELLGKPRALFCHKGMVGQLSLLRHWCELRGSHHIAFQPKSHIHHDEQSAYQQLWGMQATLIGSDTRPVDVADVSVPDSVAAVSIELPHRRAGFLLPTWPDLCAISKALAPRDTALHFDGARLFEASVHWQKSLAEVCALCDSVYVSLYKLLGAMAGGIVAADERTIEAIKPWISRSGGDVHTLFPFAISAMWGLDHYLPRTTAFCDKARHVAGLIKQVLGDEALPESVKTNSFVVKLPLSPAQTTERALQIAREKRIWLFDAVQSSSDDNTLVELQVGDALDGWSDGEILAVFSEFTAACR